MVGRFQKICVCARVWYRHVHHLGNSAPNMTRGRDVGLWSQGGKVDSQHFPAWDEVWRRESLYQLLLNASFTENINDRQLPGPHMSLVTGCQARGSG